jgi:hypothetical protein
MTIRDEPHVPATLPPGRQLALLVQYETITYSNIYMFLYYEGDSNENIKSAIKIQNTARLSCKLTIMILTV